jgi:hypothetical protein
MATFNRMRGGPPPHGRSVSPSNGSTNRAGTEKFPAARPRCDDKREAGSIAPGNPLGWVERRGVVAKRREVVERVGLSRAKCHGSLPSQLDAANRWDQDRLDLNDFETEIQSH